ncbi:hypothetical protein BPUN_1576 [Candidatus Paraburkholderia kirkii]|nr:hypothetical protein BPUN_1576 [Candidatus Paraburkholderia kirkii]
MVALQLHEIDAAPTCTEAAVALLLTSYDVAGKYKFKPQAALFRPATAEPKELPQRLEALLTAAPAPVEKLTHLWTSGFATRLAHNNVNGTLRNTEREWTRHDLSKAIGLPGTASIWLMQALAAQMVTHGQGPQLVIAPHRDGVMLNLLSKQRSHVAGVAEPAPCTHPISATLSLGCFGMLLMLLLEQAKIGNGWFVAFLVIWMLVLFIGQPIAGILKRRMVDEDFWLHAH